MQVRTITVNAAGLTPPEQGIQGKVSLGGNQRQAEGGNGFGPECKVTISREGKNLSRQQAEKDTRSAQSVREEKRLLRQQEQIELSKEIRNGYRESLNAIEKQITDYNTSYAKFDPKTVIYDGAMIDETIEEREKLKTTLENQKQFQSEESQRLAKEARQMALQSAGCQDEIDENNRDLVTLLKTMEEAEKAEEEREGGETAGDGSGTDGAASAAGSSAGDVIRNSATHFMISSVNREWNVEERMDHLEESGRWFVETANSITENVLLRSAEIKASMEDDTFTDEQIAEMVADLQKGMTMNYDNVRAFRSFGLQLQEDMKEIRLQHIADHPLKGMQETKDGMMLAAADAVLGEARQGKLNEGSQELAEEVKDLIDERNDVDRIPEEEEEERPEEVKDLQELQEQEEQAAVQEKAIQPGNPERPPVIVVG